VPIVKFPLKATPVSSVEHPHPDTLENQISAFLSSAVATLQFSNSCDICDAAISPSGTEQRRSGIELIVIDDDGNMMMMRMRRRRMMMMMILLL